VYYGFVRTIKSIKKFESSAVIFIAIDTFPEKRSEGIENYKADRPKDRFDVHSVLEMFLPYLSVCNNVYLVKQEGLEADDLFGCIPDTYKRLAPDMIRGTEFYVYTNDRDSWQVVCDNVSVFDSFKKGIPQVKGVGDCQAKWGVSPEGMALYKAIRGKGSDAVSPIVPRFPKKLAQDLCEKARTTDRLYYGLEKYRKKVREGYQKYIDALFEHKSEVIRRYDLFRIPEQNVFPYKHTPILQRLEQFIEFFKMYSMRSILK
jgi:5'-3' exonuclease